MSYIPEKTIYLCLAHMSEDGIEQKYVKEAFDTNWVAKDFETYTEQLGSAFGSQCKCF